jgi:hypothetical protein
MSLMDRYVTAFILAFSILGATTGCAQEPTCITVRVISAKTGRPMIEKFVRMTVNMHATRAITVFDRRERTDSSGAVVFHVINLPASGYITVTDIDPYQCSYGLYDLGRVMTTGAADYACPHRSVEKFALAPKPGEIVIYVGEYTRLERILYLPWHS